MNEMEVQQQVYFLDVTQKNINAYLDQFLQLKKANDVSICLKMPYNTDIDKEELKKHIDKIIEFLRKDVSKNSISVAFEFDNNKNIEKINIKDLRDWESDFSRKGIKFGFIDQLNLWTLNQVENTINIIKNNANKIKELHLSPLETLLNAYISVTKRRYKFERKGQNFAISRSVIGVTNGDSIVCTGYSELLKSIINNIANKNIQLFRNNVLIQQDNKTQAWHTNLIAYVKDDKYNIDGYYYLDPTWDYQRENDDYLRLNYFMIPLKNIKEIKKYAIRDLSINKKDFDIKSIIMPNYVKTRLRLFKNFNKIHLYYNTSDPYNGLSFTKDGLHFDNLILNNILKHKKLKNQILDNFDQFLKENYTELQIAYIKMNSNLYKNSFTKFLNKNHEFLEKIIYKTSKQVDLQALKYALYNVLCCNVKDKNKNQIYELTEKTLENNIKMSRYEFNQKAKDAFSECEYFNK